MGRVETGTRALTGRGLVVVSGGILLQTQVVGERGPVPDSLIHCIDSSVSLFIVSTDTSSPGTPRPQRSTATRRPPDLPRPPTTGEVSVRRLSCTGVSSGCRRALHPSSL